MIGYTKPLYILPFDHRGSFVKGMFGIEERELTPDESLRVIEFKKIIYDAFQKSVETTVPKEGAALLVDEQFGAEILTDAGEKGFITIITTEKSGQELFTFEYGDEFGVHLKKFSPTFAKALLRYNAQEDASKNAQQLKTLKQLSDFCHENDMKLLVEPLIPPTDTQLQEMGNDKRRFDTEVRPGLMVQMAIEFHEAGVEPDIWKVEGLSDPEQYKAFVLETQKDGREHVGTVILGRGETKDKVEEWMRAGRNVPGIVGFAVGRTIFWDPLIEYGDEKISREQAVSKISENYNYFYTLFIQA